MMNSKITNSIVLKSCMSNFWIMSHNFWVPTIDFVEHEVHRQLLLTNVERRIEEREKAREREKERLKKQSFDFIWLLTLISIPTTIVCLLLWG